jgi:hypothetical protein
VKKLGIFLVLDSMAMFLRAEEMAIRNYTESQIIREVNNNNSDVAKEKPENNSNSIDNFGDLNKDYFIKRRLHFARFRQQWTNHVVIGRAKT